MIAMLHLARLTPIVLAVALAACSGVTSENQGQLSLCLDNAAQYYDGGQYLSAIQQWDKALEIDKSNEIARLGQAMSHYQLGLAETKAGIDWLARAEKELDGLRREDLGGRQWRAELGYALTQQRWCELYDRKIRKLEEDVRRGLAPDPETAATARREFDSHVAAAESSFRRVIAGGEKEPQLKLTCWLGLAQTAAWRGDLEASLGWARNYEKQVVLSKQLWIDTAKKIPNEAAVYDAKLAGAQLTECELRNLMGNVLFKLGRLEEAERELNAVAKLFPERAATYLNRGIVREARGDLDLAKGDYKKFLALTDLPEGDASILEATRRLIDVEAKVAADDAATRPR
jgi:Tfp pilus assembly protein PilF